MLINVVLTNGSKRQIFALPCYIYRDVRAPVLCRRFEQRLVTNWRQVQLNAVWQRLYSQTDEAMQVRDAKSLASAHICAAMRSRHTRPAAPQVLLLSMCECHRGTDRHLLAHDMQVYASFKYPRTEIQRLRPGKLLQQATDFSPNMLSSPDTGESRRVGPFHMKPATAIRSAHQCPFHERFTPTTTRL